MSLRVDFWIKRSVLLLALLVVLLWLWLRRGDAPQPTAAVMETPDGWYGFMPGNTTHIDFPSMVGK